MLSAGAVQEICVTETTVGLVHAEPPIVTPNGDVVDVSNPVPVIVTDCVELTVPELGETLVIDNGTR